MRIMVFEAPKDLGRIKRASDTKRIRVPQGQPKASVAVAETLDGGGLSLLIRWHDAFDIPELHCRVWMSRQEARELQDAIGRLLEE